MSVCILSDEEIGRLRNYDIQPCHTQHRHMTIKSAVRAIVNGRMEIVEHANAPVGITPPKLYHLAKKPSNHNTIKVIQRVKGNWYKYVQPPPMLDLSKE